MGQGAGTDSPRRHCGRLLGPVVLVGAVALAACGGGSDEVPARSRSEQSTTTTRYRPRDVKNPPICRAALEEGMRVVDAEYALKDNLYDQSGSLTDAWNAMALERGGADAAQRAADTRAAQHAQLFGALQQARAKFDDAAARCRALVADEGLPVPCVGVIDEAVNHFGQLGALRDLLERVVHTGRDQVAAGNRGAFATGNALIDTLTDLEGQVDFTGPAVVEESDRLNRRFEDCLEEPVTPVS
jgi:multidrug efflux pump subunit AcrA (membrane-fusion protein)